MPRHWAAYSVKNQLPKVRPAKAIPVDARKVTQALLRQTVLLSLYSVNLLIS